MANDSTTKFRVDISELKRGIQDANRQIRLANAEFKAAAAGMDDWQSSTDGVQRKIEQLRTVLANQKAILSAYEKQLELIVQSEGENSKAADEMRIKIANQQATVNSTEKSISQYSTKLDELQKAENGAGDGAGDLSNDLKSTTKSADEAASGFTVLKGALADLVASGIKAAVKGLKDLASAAKESFAAFDEGRDVIIAKTGALGDQAEDLMDAYKGVAKTVTSDFSDIGAAIGEVSTRFGVTGDELESLSTKFLKFSKLNGTNVSDSVDDVQKALSAFGLSGDKAADILDILNKVGQDTGVSVGTLTKGLIQNATAFQEMGLNVRESAVLMGQMEKSGANSETVMNGLRKALKSATKDGISLSDALAKLEEEITSGTDSTAGLQAAYDAFGKSGDQIYGALANGTLSFKSIASAAEDFSGNLDATYEGTQDATDKIKLAFQGMKVEFGDTVDGIVAQYAPQIEEAIANVTPVVQNIIAFLAEKIPPTIAKLSNAFETAKAGFDWIKENSTAIIASIAGITTALTVFAISTMGVTGLKNALLSLEIVQKAVTAAQWLMNAAMNANPIGIVVAAIAGLVAAFVVLWNKSEGFRDFWLGLWDSIKKNFAGFVDDWGNGVETIKQFFTGIVDFFKENWQTILLFIINPFAGAFKYLYEHVDAFRNFVDGVLDKIKTGWKNFIKAWGDGIDTIKAALASVGKFFADTWQKLKSGAKDAWEGIKGVFGAVADWFGDKFLEAWERVKAVFSVGGKIFDGIKDGIVSAFKSVVNAIIRGLNKVIAIPFNAINATLDKIRDVSIAGFQPFKNLVSRFDVPQIPELEQGGVLRRGQIGLLEGNGAEAVVPLDKNRAWIAATAAELRKAMQSEGIVGAAGKSNGAQVSTSSYTFNQYNNSPKALSRLEIYRQSKNLLALRGVT